MLRNEMKRKATDLTNLSAAQSPNSSTSNLINNGTNESNRNSSHNNNNNNNNNNNSSNETLRPFSGADHPMAANNGSSLTPEQLKQLFNYQQSAVMVTQIMNGAAYPAFSPYFQPITPNSAGTFSLPLIQGSLALAEQQQMAENSSRASGKCDAEKTTQKRLFVCLHVCCVYGEAVLFVYGPRGTLLNRMNVI